MNLDQHGLPVQTNGDANDQLQRVSMIVAGVRLNPQSEHDHYYDACLAGLNELLQPKPGIYARHVEGNANNVSADQLISALAAHVSLGNTKQVAWMFFRMLCRLGFAQNYKDGLNGQERTKIPDFMLLRALPLFARASRWIYPFAAILDFLLLCQALAACGPVWRDDKGFTKRSPDDVDDNVTVLTLAVCRYRMPTPLSWLACKIYGKLRPWNWGCTPSDTYPNAYADSAQGVSDKHHPVYGALRWYHRAETGGNPEIAELWKPICERYFE